MGKLSYERGRAGEELACRYFLERGYQLLGRNYRCPHGEIDLLFQREGVIHFVEVKARSSFDYGQPQEAVDPKKIGRLRYAAHYFLSSRPDLAAEIDYLVFDIFEVDLSHKKFRLIPDAFGMGG